MPALTARAGMQVEYKQFEGQTPGASLSWETAADGVQYLATSRMGLGAEVRGSPFSNTVKPSIACGSSSFARGSGFTVGTVGTTALFTIYAKDAFGNREIIGGDRFDIEQQYLQTGVFKHGVADDRADGSYAVSYATLTKAGSFDLATTLAVQGGLMATYYDDTALSDPKGSKVDDRVTLLSFGSVRPNDALSDAGTFSVRWQGKVECPNRKGIG
jgi:hypothetical protein